MARDEKRAGNAGQDRKQRLAEKLRENLRRRKSQMKERREAEAQSNNEEVSPSHQNR